jgi:hypothetical protein
MMQVVSIPRKRCHHGRWRPYFHWDSGDAAGAMIRACTQRMPMIKTNRLRDDILAVSTVIFSLYGMNFERMPELKTAWGYPVTVFVTVADGEHVEVRGFGQHKWQARTYTGSCP